MNESNGADGDEEGASIFRQETGEKKIFLPRVNANIFARTR